MKFVKPMLLASGLAVLIGMGACSSHHHSNSHYVQQYDIECDAGDYMEHDDDCGYYDSHHHWVYYTWASPGHTSYAPYGWAPPKGVKTHYKTKKVVNPKYRAPAKRQVNPKTTNRVGSAPKYTGAPNRVGTAPKTNTVVQNKKYGK